MLCNCKCFVCLLLFFVLYALSLFVKFLLVFIAFGKVLLWRLHGRTHSCIVTILNSAWAVVVVDSKVTEVRENFVEDEC